MVTIATITHKNQLTIPKEFMENSSIEGIKKVLLEKVGDKILIKPLKSKVEELAGSLSHLAKGKSTDWKKIRSETQKIVAREIASEGL